VYLNKLETHSCEVYQWTLRNPQCVVINKGKKMESATIQSNDTNLIRSMVRSGYDLQKTRIQTGNRITGNFKVKLGFVADGMTEAQLASAEKKILEDLRSSYQRITDGIIEEGRSSIEGKLPTLKKFKADGMITTYTELVLVDQYENLLKNEEKHFFHLGKLLVGIPLYDQFLSTVTGVGVKMAAVLISEIDISKAEYSSSLWKYCGLDVVTIGKYIDGSGKEHVLPAWAIDAYFENNDGATPMMADNKYPVTMTTVGRSKKDFCLVKREYTNKEGEKAIRDSITHNPFLKTKLIGVLGPAFLKSGKTLVDGKNMGEAKRLELAVQLGFKVPKSIKSAEVKELVIGYLMGKGMSVVVEHSTYGEDYYRYKNRIANDPKHKDKSDGHRHNMAIRYCVKRFLVDYYLAARTIAGLPVAVEYSEGKLGMVHKKAA